MSQRLALLIGNNEYHDPSLAKLVSPPQDVTQLGELLRDPAIGGFDRVDTLENRSFSTVRRTIASFFTKNKRDDLLVLYFSGHGVLDDNGQLYLAVKDTERELLSATSIEAPFITSLMDRSISRRQILMLDCCHSGAFGRSKGGLGASVGTATTFEGKGYGRIILTASDATQYAWEGDDFFGEAQSSVFTRHLVEGLRTGAADTDADGQITLDELYDYVYENVVAETPRQTPAKWSYRQQGTIVIAHNPSPVLLPAELPAELVAAMESPFAGIRQGAVQDLTRLHQGSDRGLAYAAKLALQKMADDDSRSVSQAARDALGGVEGAILVQPSSIAEASPPGQSAAPPADIRDAGAAVEAEPLRSSAARARAVQDRSAAALDNPYLVIAAGWSITWIASLLSAHIFNTVLGFLLLWFIGGLLTGGLLFRKSKTGRWRRTVILATVWVLSFDYIFILTTMLYQSDVFSFDIATIFFITAAFSMIGIKTSLAILRIQGSLPTESDE